jgi:hypothetical protein
MIENYDLKTTHQQVTNTLTTLKDIDGVAIGAVPANMKRYITFIKVTNTYTAAATLAIGQGDTDPVLTAEKDRQKLATGDTIMYPDSPNADHPIMSIAAGKFLVAQMENASETADVTIGYYDK